MALICTLSISAPAEIDPVADAEKVYNAIRGLGTDESALRKLLTRRSCDQRLQIGWAYEDIYKETVAKVIKEDTSGSYQTLLLSLFTCDTALYALHLYEAFTGGDDESVAEILIRASESPEIQKSLENEYYLMHFTKLERDIKAETKGDHYDFRTEIFKKSRKPSQGKDSAKAAETAKMLKEEMSTWNKKKSNLNAALMEESFEQARAIFDEFKTHTGIEIEQAIDDHIEGNEKKGYKQLVHFLRDKRDFFVDRLWDSFPDGVEKLTANELTIMRIVLIETEKNLNGIRNAFKTKYGASLRQKIKTGFELTVTCSSWGNDEYYSYETLKIASPLISKEAYVGRFSGFSDEISGNE